MGISQSDSLVAQTVKRLPAMRKTRGQSLGWKIPWRRKWQPTPVLFPTKFHGWWAIAHGVMKSRTWLSDFTHSLTVLLRLHPLAKLKASFSPSIPNTRTLTGNMHTCMCTQRHASPFQKLREEHKSPIWSNADLPSMTFPPLPSAIKVQPHPPHSPWQIMTSQISPLAAASRPRSIYWLHESGWYSNCYKRRMKSENVSTWKIKMTFCSFLPSPVFAS